MQSKTTGKILITGANGFVGRALYEALNKHCPKADILAPSSRELNLLDYAKTEEYLRDASVDYIYHLAAQHGCVSLVSEKPLEMLETNLQINYNIVHAAMQTGVKKFITLGSSCSYSVDAPLPNSEKDLWYGHPENSYGVCKLVLLEHLASQKDMDWVYFVPANLYGAGDHFGGKNMHIIPATVMKFRDALASGKNEIEVWGDGTQLRDFVYIDDLICFLLAALRDKRYEKQVLNIGTGTETSVRELVEAIRKELGVTEKIAIRWNPEKPTGIMRKSLCNSELMKLEPDYKFVEMSAGLKETLKAYKI